VRKKKELATPNQWFVDHMCYLGMKELPRDSNDAPEVGVWPLGNAARTI